MSKAKFQVNRPPPPYDKGWAWLVVLGTFLDCFIMLGTMKSYGLFLLALLDRFDISVAVASFPASVAGIVYALSTPIMLMLSERYTIRRIVILGGIIGFVTISMSSLLFNIEYFIVVFGVGIGMAHACFYANGLVIIGLYFRKRLSLATGLGLAGSSIGQFLMPPIINYLLETFTLPGTLAIIAGLHLNAAVAGMLFRPLSMYGPEPKDDTAGRELEEMKTGAETEALVQPELEKNGNAVEKTNKDGANITSSAGVEGQDKLLRDSLDDEVRFSHEKYSEADKLTHDDPADTDDDDSDADDRLGVNVEKLTSSNQQLAVLATQKPKKKNTCRRLFDFSAIYSHVTKLYLLVTMLVFLGYFNFTFYLPAFITEKGIMGYEKALLVSFTGAGDLVSRIGTGFIADFNLMERYKIQVIAAILCGSNVFIAIYADSFWWMAVHCVCYGLFGGAFASIMSVVLLDFVGRDLLSRNLAVMMPTHGIGVALSQIALSSIKDVTGSYDLVVAILSLCIITGGVGLLLYPLVRRWEDSRLDTLAARQAAKKAAHAGV